MENLFKFVANQNYFRMSLKIFLTTTFLSIMMAYCPMREPDWVDYKYSRYEPKVMQREIFEKSIEVLAPATMQNAGKIYLKDNLLFLGDTNKGFHVYDNSDPKNPVAVAFLSIPGATDLAIRDDVMYVNQAVDLVALSYDAVTKKVQIHKRIQQTFPEMRSPDGYYFYQKENEIIVDWILKK